MNPQADPIFLLAKIGVIFSPILAVLMPFTGATYGLFWLAGFVILGLICVFIKRARWNTLQQRKLTEPFDG